MTLLLVVRTVLLYVTQYVKKKTLNITTENALDQCVDRTNVRYNVHYCKLHYRGWPMCLFCLQLQWPSLCAKEQSLVDVSLRTTQLHTRLNIARGKKYEKAKRY